MILDKKRTNFAKIFLKKQFFTFFSVPEKSEKFFFKKILAAFFKNQLFFFENFLCRNPAWISTKKKFSKKNSCAFPRLRPLCPNCFDFVKKFSLPLEKISASRNFFCYAEKFFRRRRKFFSRKNLGFTEIFSARSARTRDLGRATRDLGRATSVARRATWRGRRAQIFWGPPKKITKIPVWGSPKKNWGSPKKKCTFFGGPPIFFGDPRSPPGTWGPRFS